MSLEEAIAAAVERAVQKEVPRAMEQAMARLQPASVPSGEYLKTTEAAKVAHVHVDTIRSWLKAGKLPKHFAGGRLRVLRSDLDRLLASGPPEDDGPSAEDIAASALAKRKGKTT